MAYIYSTCTEVHRPHCLKSHSSYHQRDECAARATRENRLCDRVDEVFDDAGVFARTESSVHEKYSICTTRFIFYFFSPETATFHKKRALKFFQYILFRPNIPLDFVCFLYIENIFLYIYIY